MAHKDRIEAPSPVEHEFCGIHVILGLFEPFLGSFTHRSSSFWVLYVARSAVSGGESSQAIRLLAHPWGPETADRATYKTQKEEDRWVKDPRNGSNRPSMTWIPQNSCSTGEGASMRSLCAIYP